jgi:hypothetical protein
MIYDCTSDTRKENHEIRKIMEILNIDLKNNEKY